MLDEIEPRFTSRISSVCNGSLIFPGLLVLFFLSGRLEPLADIRPPVSAVDLWCICKSRWVSSVKSAHLLLKSSD